MKLLTGLQHSAELKSLPICTQRWAEVKECKVSMCSGVEEKEVTPRPQQLRRGRARGAASEHRWVCITLLLEVSHSSLL